MSAVDVIDWPMSAMRVRSENWRLEGATISSGGVFGPGTVVNVENRVWMCDLDLANLAPNMWRRVRAILDEARGQYGVLNIPVIVGQQFDQALAQPATFDGGVMFAAMAGVPAGGFAALDFSTVTVSESVEAGATLMRLSVPSGAVYLSAMFTTAEGHLYRISGTSGGRVRFNPPLRAPLAAGSPLEFSEPKVRMRLAVDDAGLRRLASGLTAPKSLPIVESFR